MRRKVSLLLVLSILILALGGLSYASNETTALYQLKLLAGDGTGFNLQSQLKRRDAAAFIVKFLGKNEFVKSRVDIYNNTNFSDVDRNAWYAPYVGYLVRQDIVNGYGDGTFKPDESVSEKAFIKMALVAMGYEYDEDFNWDNIFQKAFEKGLVEDINYAVLTEDNYDFTRGDVVSIIYNTLDEPIKNENRTVVQRLVDEDVVSSNVAENLDLIQRDEEETKIVDVTVASETEIVVEFNESISGYDVLIEDTSGDALEVTSQSLLENVLTLETEVQVPDEDYTLVLENVVDENNFIVDQLSESFNGFVQPIVESIYFEVSKIDVLSKKEIEIFFTHPIDEQSELALLYSIKKDGIEVVEGSSRTMVANSSTGNDRSVKIWLVDDILEEGGSYTIDINGDLQSKYTVYLNKGNGQEFAFTGTNQEPDALKLTDLKVLNDDYLRLTFNKALDEITALDVNNYSLDNLDSSSGSYNQASDVKFSGSGDLAMRQVDVKFFNMTEGDEYELELDDIEDYYKYDEIVNFEEDFLCDVNDNGDEESTVTLEDAIAVNEKTIRLYFDGELGNQSENAVITLSGESIAEKIVDEEKPYMMTLILSSTFRDNETEDLKIIDGLYDINGNKVDGVLTLEDITGSDESIGDIKIDAADFISDNKIRVVFDRPVDTDRSDSTTDYVLEYEDEDNNNHDMTADEVLFVSNTTVILTFDTEENINLYDLVITDVFDFTGHETDKLQESLERPN